MRYILIVVFITFILALYLHYLANTNKVKVTETISPTRNEQASNNAIPQVSIIAENLDTPWSLVFLPDKNILVTERPGRVQRIDQSGKLSLVATLPQVKEIGEGGLLGMVLHPQFTINHYIYFYYTYSENGANTLNRVVRMKYDNGKLSDEKIMIDKIPGAPNHNGGRFRFGPDDLLYITTGDAQAPSLAQDTSSLAGKILRMTDEGKVPGQNPFHNYVYSYGHRNPQGIAWSTNGQLWETEHGPSGIETGNDEINKIISGKNYGWPTIRGTQTHAGMETPVKESGFLHAWAPGSLAILNHKLYFSGLKGEALYMFDPQTNIVQEYLKSEYGRIREVIVGPDETLYITTSNNDGRGSPQNDDDKIIRVNPSKL